MTPQGVILSEAPARRAVEGSIAVESFGSPSGLSRDEWDGKSPVLLKNNVFIRDKED